MVISMRPSKGTRAVDGKLYYLVWSGLIVFLRMVELFRLQVRYSKEKEHFRCVCQSSFDKAERKLMWRSEHGLCKGSENGLCRGWL